MEKKGLLIKLPDKKAINDSQVDEKLLKFYYEKANDYRINYSSGTIGCITPSGDILMHFFYETATIPTCEIWNTKNNVETIYPESDGIDRIISNGIIINIDTAINIHRWLGNLIESLSDTNKQKA